MKQIYVSNNNFYKIEIAPKSKIFCITFFFNNIHKNKQFFIKTEEVDDFVEKNNWQKMNLCLDIVEKIQYQLKEYRETKDLWC
ncbi:MAG: hypothetical protein KDH96_00525 [Candidatus Riesia sp.]|nr:hypothetical protein [Candidatus Riesia sp.]